MRAPTGIDRVERAYIRWVSDAGGRFLARVNRRTHLLDAGAVDELIAWLDGTGPAPGLDVPARLRPHRDRRLRRAQALVRSRGAPLSRAMAELSGSLYLNVGHANLREGLLDGLRVAGCRTAVMVHDLIPLEHPMDSGAGSPRRFRGFLKAATGADLLLTNSRDTAKRLRRYLTCSPVIAPLGVEPARVDPIRPHPADPAFLCVGTIEPRKNHALLLDIWASLGPAAPRLRIAGRRGWRNRPVFDRLDHDPMMGQTVHELGVLDDRGLAAEIAGATALLFPSRAEGYGLPVAEALEMGTPVIASDLPALREVGGDAPEWLAPDDPDAWRMAILAYARRPSPMREAQLARIAEWRPQAWADHFAIVRTATGLSMSS